MKETILAPRQGLYPLFKCSGFDSGTRTKLNVARNRGKHVLRATQQGDVRKRNSVSNTTGTLPAMQQGEVPTHTNQTKNTATCTKNKTQWFCSWEVVLALVLVGILVHSVGGPVGGMSVSCGL
jgi:hypothetical protein